MSTEQCRCAQSCGRPAYKRGYSMACYQRWARCGKPAEGPPDPMTYKQRIERRSQVRAAMKAAEPVPAGAGEYALAEASRRIGRERDRADAYLAVRGGRDQIAPRRVQERVGDAEAFRVLGGLPRQRQGGCAAPGGAGAAHHRRGSGGRGVSETRPGEVRVFQRAADGRWAVGVDAPELEGELRVATERDATPVARFVGQALAALRYGEGK